MEEDEFATVKETATARIAGGTKDSNPAFGAISLSLDTPATVEVSEISEMKTFRYTYRCKHCGHVWIEERPKFKLERTNGEYKAD
jgi:predicted SprT family Zn-dependent metalloprotease